MILCRQRVEAWRNPLPQTLQTNGLAPEGKNKKDLAMYDNHLIFFFIYLNNKWMTDKLAYLCARAYDGSSCNEH